MAEILILRVINTNDDANREGEIPEYVTTVIKQKGTALGAADSLVYVYSPPGTEYIIIF